MAVARRRLILSLINNLSTLVFYSIMNVLVGCEYSGVVRDAFAARGHNAWSVDLLPSDRPNPKHVQGDIFDMIEGDWDLAIFHPPCTDLAISGAAHFPEKIKDGRQQRAIKFVERLYYCGIPRICIENPVGVLSTKHTYWILYAYARDTAVIKTFNKFNSALLSSILDLLREVSSSGDS